MEISNTRRGESSLHQQIADLSPWFHNLHLPDGTQTAPDTWLNDFPAYKWEAIAPHIPANLEGWSALDIGCNAGFYTFELARKGATVTGIDVDQHYLRQAQWAVKQFGLEDRVTFERMQVYDLSRIDQRFDLVLFMGVFYHLRYPMLALDIVAQKVRRLMVFQTVTLPGTDSYEPIYDMGLYERDALCHPGWPRMAFIEHRFSGDPTNWWIPNHAGVEAMLHSSGLRIISRPQPETYICEPDPEHPSCVFTWNTRELLAATGRAWGKE